MPSASVRPKTEEAPEAPEAPPALPALPPADASDAPAAAPGAVVPWETRFAELAEYKANNGDCNVPVGQGELGRWESVHFKSNLNLVFQAAISLPNGV